MIAMMSAPVEVDITKTTDSTGTSEYGADRSYIHRWQRLVKSTLHMYIWGQILAALPSGIIARVWTRARWCSNCNDGLWNKGHWLYTFHFCTLHAYLSSAYACASVLLSNIWRWTYLWSGAVLHNQPWRAHGGNSMGLLKWSHIYIRSCSLNLKISLCTNFTKWDMLIDLAKTASI